MEKKLSIDTLKLQTKRALLKSNAELQSINGRNEVLRSAQRSESALAVYNELGLDNIGHFHSRNILTLTEFSVPLTLSTYRPLACPMPKCGTRTCPSALLPHLKYHKELPSSELLLDGSITVCDILDSFSQLKPLQPTPLHLFIVNTEQYQEFPVLLNACWLKSREEEEISTGRWLAVWISCLYTTPMWFRLQFLSYSPNSLNTITYISKVLEIREELTMKEMAKNVNVMLLHRKSLLHLYENEQSMNIGINVFPITVIKVQNSTEVSIV